jgi:hypothetical protein
MVEILENNNLQLSTITPFLAGCNTEFKCAAIEPLAAQVGEPMTEREMYDATILDITTPLLSNKITPNHMGNALSRLPTGLVEISINPETEKRQYALTKEGLLSAAIGGHLMRLSEISNTPIRSFVGEYSANKLPEGSINSLEARVLILGGLYKYARRKWRSTTFLHEQLEKHGLNLRPTETHLGRLKEAGLVNHRVTRSPEGWNIAWHRIKPANSNIYDPAKIIGGYLDIIGQFALMDAEFLDEGLDQLSRVCHDEKTMPFMIKRSFVSASRPKK